MYTQPLFYLNKLTHLRPMGNDSEAMTQNSNWDDCLQQVGTAQDKVAFTALFSHYSPLLMSYLKSGSNMSQESAEELVQETMIKVWRRAPSFSANQASASTWIYTIARNTRIDWYRKNQRQEPLSFYADDIYGGTQESEEPSPYSTLLQLRKTKHIRQQLGELPQEQSDVLTMMYFKGLSGQQVAQVLTLPLGTVKSRIRLALKKLKIGLATQASENPEGDQDA